MTTFGPLFVPTPFRAAVADDAWLVAMLEVERALVNALSLAGVIPPHSAVAVAERCVPSLYDVSYNDDGTIAAQGTHNELLETSAVYREIYEHGLLEAEFASRVEATA